MGKILEDCQMADKLRQMTAKKRIKKYDPGPEKAQAAIQEDMAPYMVHEAAEVAYSPGYPGSGSAVFHTRDTPPKELRSAFRKKGNWVVCPEAGGAAHLTTVILNLAGKFRLPEEATAEDVRSAVVEGFSKEAFVRLKEVLGITAEELCEVVRINQRTVARREHFKPDESERILRVASAFQRAIEVLGSLEKARRWFTGEKRALGNRTPLEFCDTEPGAAEVRNLLGRIDHGVFT